MPKSFPEFSVLNDFWTTVTYPSTRHLETKFLAKTWFLAGHIL
jgi:hypothetical protein